MFNDQRHLLLINYCKAKFKSLPTFKHEKQVFFREFVMYKRLPMRNYFAGDINDV